MNIKNWKRHQHYKNRTPPWIKLHREILDDPKFVFMDPSEFKVLILCWLIASETDDGSLPASDVLAFRLRLASNVLADCVSSLCAKGLVVDASNQPSPCKQDASNVLAQSRVETETEEIIVLNKPPLSTTKKARLKQADMPDGFKEFWDAYGKKVNVKKSIKYWSDMSTEEKAECMIAVPKYAASREKVHRLDPERYLRDKRWHDEIVTHAGTAHAQSATDSEWWVCRKLCARPEPKHKCPDGQCYTCRTEREVITAKDRDEAVAKMKEKIDRECAF
jgi:hypothetical protein